MENNLKYLALILILIGVWQYFGDNSAVARLFVSSPKLLSDYFLSHYKQLSIAVLTTFTEAILGLLLATLVSFGLMCICFYRPTFMDFILPIMVAAQIVPVIVLAPFFIILFGIGLTSKIVMAALISFFPIFINFAQGYAAISSDIHALMKIYQAPLYFRITRVYFPLAMPSIMSGLKVSATLAVLGAIVAEFTGAKVGIGKNLFVSSIRLDPDLMMVSLILASVIGLLMYGAIWVAERKFGRWYV